MFTKISTGLVGWSLGESSDDDVQQESQRGTSSHSQSDNNNGSDLDSSLDDLETSTEWKFEEHFLLSCWNGLQGKLMKTQLGQRRKAVFTNCSCSCPQHGKFYNSAAEIDRELLKLQIRGHKQAESVSRQLWRKWIDAAELEWEKLPAEFHSMKCT